MATASPSFSIFRTGTFQDIHGTTHSFSAADLADVVASYDATNDPAPLVIGHPQNDDAAMGWVGSLAIEGDRLVAAPSDLLPEFAEAVRAKKFRKVSASFYPPAHPANPAPGRWRLKHVGFLGAAAPAVKGLGTVSFSEIDEAEAFTLPFSPESNMTDATDIPTDAAFAEREGTLADREAAVAARETLALEKEAALIAGEKIAAHNANVSFAEAQVAGGRLAPAGKDKVVVLLDALSTLDTVSFGEEGDLRPADAFRALFASAAPVVSFSEAAPADTAISTDPAEKPETLAQRAVSFMESEKAAGRDVTVQAAVRHVHANPPV